MEIEVIAMGVVKHGQVILRVYHKLYRRQIVPVMRGAKVAPGLESPGKQYNLTGSPKGVASINPDQQGSIRQTLNLKIRGKNVE